MENVANTTLVYSYTLGNEYPPPMIQYGPVRWIAYLMSALFPLLAVRVLMVARQTRRLWVCAASLTSLLMFISLLLRGAMGRTDSDAFRMYETQTVLHLCSGYILVGLLLAFAARWVEVASQGMVGTFLIHLGLGYTVAALVCTCAGFPLAFDSVEERRISGYRLVSVSLIVSLGMCLLGTMLVVYHATVPGSSVRTGAKVAHPLVEHRLVMVVVPTVLLLAWASFELARMSLPMHSMANTSDALYYCLSVLPVVGAMVLWTSRAEEFFAAEPECGQGGGGPSDWTAEASKQTTMHRGAMGQPRFGGVAGTGTGTGTGTESEANWCCCCCGKPPAFGTCGKCKYERMMQHAMLKYV
ncbi:hypothetical protein IW140_000488 [Coemansia sp. RSA 1813]|nr:hypothetical protein EV178_000553 [Coemansia sp. RSA 1646]KAJ1771258.1 hypothetical protein LPJ74_002526 [Coemansia sp. RSA 1843]KAJ2092827.1 hypothetical protein IW138_000922 [Coemansia sp. RSA 986]KAJ2217673.1 hypothetical protein EV179_000158 [Coemansia sp. RSA 487]KAJ2573089.1 hypothetical protein IW140_000488 [Coemansia sp. RSA 1813]